jgi:polyhydroxyalkanoate synthase subunit PhaC
MPAARRSASKPTTRPSQGVRARAAARSSATRREVEQSITRFEKRLDEANDALKTLGGHLGTGARGSYKEVTAALTALRRSAAKTNKEALKDFDKLRAALTKTSSSAGASRTKRSSTSASTSRSGSRSSASRPSSSRSTAARKTTARKTTTRKTASRSTASSSRAKKS